MENMIFKKFDDLFDDEKLQILTNEILETRNIINSVKNKFFNDMNSMLTIMLTEYSENNTTDCVSGGIMTPIGDNERVIYFDFLDKFKQKLSKFGYDVFLEKGEDFYTMTIKY